MIVETNSKVFVNLNRKKNNFEEYKKCLDGEKDQKNVKIKYLDH